MWSMCLMCKIVVGGQIARSCCSIDSYKEESSRSTFGCDARTHCDIFDRLPLVHFPALYLLEHSEGAGDISNFSIHRCASHLPAVFEPSIFSYSLSRTRRLQQFDVWIPSRVVIMLRALTEETPSGKFIPSGLMGTNPTANTDCQCIEQKA